MSEEILADKILRWIGENPIAYYPEDKWPAIVAKSFLYSLPVVFGLLLIAPFFLIWLKKKKWTLRNIGLAILQGIGLIILGLILLFFFAAYLQGKAFEALNSV